MLRSAGRARGPSDRGKPFSAEMQTGSACARMGLPTLDWKSHMALATSYLFSPKNFGALLEAMRRAQAPERFTIRFLEELGFKGKGDRKAIGVLKDLGFLEESGAPTERYFAFLDESQSGRVLAEAVLEAYDDLFRVNRDAHLMSNQDVFNKLKTLTKGQKSDNVLNRMTSTFATLCALGDFSAVHDGAVQPAQPSPAAEPSSAGGPATTPVRREEQSTPQTHSRPVAQGAAGGVSLRYDIHVHLPASRDQAVYDAIFRSLKEHLL